MPSVSAKQHRAMEAAAHGHSNLGIPASVGKEFEEADKGKHFSEDEDPAVVTAAATIFEAPDGAILLVLRSQQEPNYGGYWALPGGKGEPDESPLETANRESDEELGAECRRAWQGEPTLVDETVTRTGINFSTFLQPARFRFYPTLNEEHSGFAWVSPHQLPSPIHPGVLETIQKVYGNVGVDEASRPKLSKSEVDYSPGKGDERCSRCIHFIEGGRCEVVKGLIDPDYWCEEFEFNVTSDNQACDAIAMDKSSVRQYDADGHLHVERTPISKAVINPYYGREIPNYRELHLEPDRIYKLYRDPKELARAASTFAGKPLLSTHTPVNADSHPKSVVIGTIGDDVQFEGPYLTAPLTVWDGDAIKLIEADEQRELSCGYKYDPDMTPGEVDGEPYDGVMRNIRGNHVALVEEGRAGPDVLVQDEALRVDKTKARGGYSEKDKETASPHKEHREEMPESAFLLPGERKYPVKEKKDGKWEYDRELLLGAAREARMHGHEELAAKADRIRKREFDTMKIQGKDEWSDAAREAAARVRKAGHVGNPAARAAFEKQANSAHSEKKDDPAKEKAREAAAAKVRKAGHIGNPAARAAFEKEANRAHSEKKKGNPAFRKAFMEAAKANSAGKDSEIMEKEDDKTEDELSTGANSAMPASGMKAKDEDPGREFLKSKLSAEDMKAYDELMSKEDEAEDEEKDDDAEDENEAEREANEGEGERLKEREEKEKDQDKAMDAAIRAAVRGTEKRVAERVRQAEREIRAAEKDCLPYVGDMGGMVFDSAPDVYRHALKILDVPEAATIHESALKTVLRMQPKAGSKPTRVSEPAMAADASMRDAAVKFAPGLANITIGV